MKLPQKRKGIIYIYMFCLIFIIFVLGWIISIETIGQNLKNIFWAIEIIAIVGLIFLIYKQNQRIRKLQSGEIPTNEIIGIVKKIDFAVTRGYHVKQGRYFIALYKNPQTKETEEYQSIEYPLVGANLGTKIGVPGVDNQTKLRENISKYIKVGDKVTIHVDNDDNSCYYIESPLRLKEFYEQSEKGFYKRANIISMLLGIGWIILLVIVGISSGFVGYAAYKDNNLGRFFICSGILLLIIILIILIIRYMTKKKN